MHLSLIAAMSKNRVIGLNNGIPWKLPSDMRKFKETTTGKIVVMGRRTWDSMGRKPLPNRLNFIITKDEKLADSFAYTNPTVFGFTALMPALHYASQVEAKTDEVMIIGGASLYTECLPMAKRVYLSTVDIECEGDTFFPVEDFDWIKYQFNLVESEEITDPKSYLVSDETKQPLTYRYEVFERKPIVATLDATTTKEDSDG